MNDHNNSEIFIDINCDNIIYADDINDHNNTDYTYDTDNTDDKYIEKNQDERNIKYDNIEILNYTNNSHVVNILQYDEDDIESEYNSNNSHVVNILQYDEDDIESEYNSNIHEHNLQFTKILKIFIFVMIMFLCILLFYAIR